MFKLCPTKFLVGVIAWLTLMVWLAINALKPLLNGVGVSVSLSLAVATVQFVVTLIVVTPLWRVLWWLLPKLNEWIYPDLNGDWDVELRSNWPRIDTLLKSASGELQPTNFRTGDEDVLPPLSTQNMRARIRQSWSSMDMELWSSDRVGPIKDSKTLVVEPFRGNNGKHGLAYIFEQANKTDVVSDDTKFHGAAWIELDRDDPNVLCGTMWSDRMWRRGMNTAADLRFRRKKF
jgi:hypothetical protein